jgi:hypothetical protein
VRVEKLEVFSEASNAAVVRIKQRRFPGIVIQGDSLWILTHAAAGLVERAVASRDEELTADARELHELLSGYLAHYESVLLAHDMELPYVRPGAI